MTISATDFMCEHLIAEFKEVDRLKGLSDLELIHQVLKTEAVECLEVQELLSRFRPSWIEETGE